MLCDRLLEIFGDPRLTRDAIAYSQFGAGPAARGLAEVVHSLLTAQRFVLSPHVVETINGLADPRAVARMRQHLFFPADITWLEWAGRVPWFPLETRLGVMFYRPAGAPGMPTKGPASIFAPNIDPNHALAYQPIPGTIDLAADPSWRPLVPQHPSTLRIDGTLFAAWLGAALALISTPRIARVVDHDHGAANKARQRRGKLPFLSWSEVVMNLDTGLAGNGQLLTETGQRRYHHVRAFLRLQRGKVVPVRPHWRGNPELGTVRHRHAVQRAEDAGEDFAWKGGPLPKSEILP